MNRAHSIELISQRYNAAVRQYKRGLPVTERTSFLRNCRGAVAVMFAFSLFVIIIAIGAGIDMSRISDARAIMQRAVDNGALSGAAAYTLNASAFNTLAMTMAQSSFCDAVYSNASGSSTATNALPAGFSVVATASSVATPTVETCAGSPGPNVSAVTGGYAPGTPATYANMTGTGCTATNTVVTGKVCGFIVTVTASATMNSLFPVFFGSTKTIQVTGIAANPFISLPNAVNATLSGSAYNVNSVWVYPVLLDANGNPDFVTNAGALPNAGCSSSAPTCSDVSPYIYTTSNADQNACTDSPLIFACGNYIMLASTNYSNCTSACTPAGGYPAGTQFLNGAVVNPTAPPSIVTATTPIAFAFESIAGGARSYGTGNSKASSNPNNGCYNPYAVYNTASQFFSNSANDNTPGVSPTPTQALDWHLVTHWFYSSYLANNLPPSYGEILSQSASSANLSYPSVGVGQSNNTFSPTLATCAAATGNTTTQYTTFPGTVSNASTAKNNRSLFIMENYTGTAGATGYADTNYYPGEDSTNDFSYTPAGTPGYQYAALSCQSFGNNQFTFFWNDMSGSVGYGDDLNYTNGTAYVKCHGSSFVVLIG